MFNYKNWKFYYPGVDALEPDPEPSADPVVDENGNSITPDSLKKNMTIPAEGPGNDLEKVLDNMNGADPAHKVEGTSGLIKQMNELADNPSSGGAFWVNFDPNEMTADKTFSQISAAYTNKQVIMLNSPDEAGDIIYYTSHTQTGENGDLISISFCRVGNVSTRISVNDENMWSIQ